MLLLSQVEGVGLFLAPLDAYPLLKTGKLLPEGTSLEDIPAKFQILVKV